MMKVLYITPGLGAGGAERQASILLPALRRREIDARVLALDSGGPFVEPLRSAGVPVEVMHMRHRFDLRPLLRSTLVRKFVPDVIVSRGVSGIYVGQALAGWRHAAHVYNDHRGVGVELSRRRHAMLALLARSLSAVIVVAHDQGDGWLRYGFPREKIDVIPNGVVIPDAVPCRVEIRHDLALPEEAVVAVIVASLRPVKRVPEFVHAVRRARQRCPELIGVIVGDGPERNAVLRAGGGDPAIRLLGHRNDVGRVLQAADILVLSSAHEAMPMAILEGMAASLPVVATDVGAVSTAVNHGATGLLVPPEDLAGLTDALVTLVADRDLRRRMGHSGYELCHRSWTAEQMTDRYVAALTRARAERPRRRYRQESRAQALASGFLRYIDKRGWVTWECTFEDADVLTVTNAWPESSRPTRAPFLRYTVEALVSAGVKTDLVYVRGYKGKHVYLLACAAMAVLPVARPNQYRLVNSHGGETALAARFFWGAPVLATYWGSDLLGVRVGGLSTRLRFILSSRLVRLHACLMTATTTKSEQMELVLPRSVRRRNWVIPDGVDPVRFRSIDRLQARASLGWATDCRVVITAGRGRGKRWDLAEQAVRLAAREIPEVRWYGLADVPPEEMPLYYSAADLLLHTSSSEGSPNVIKEAIVCGLPVVSTAVGDIEHLLNGLEPSAICDDRPETLAREVVRVLHEGRRSNGHERIESLRIDLATARTLACYRSLGWRHPSQPVARR